MEVQNVVGTGNLGVEVDLNSVIEDIDVVEARYDPDVYPCAYLRLSESGPLLMVYRTGKYNLTGAESVEELHRTHTRFLRRLVDIHLIQDDVDDQFRISNIVSTATLGQEIDLNALAVAIGLENVEYEPEQFPGLIYHPPDLNCGILVFGSGKVVITGTQTVEEAEEAFITVRDRVKDLLSI